MDALLGSPDLVMAPRLPKPMMESGLNDSSVPPHRAASAKPKRMARYASPTQWVPVAHAVTTLVHSPRSP